MVEAFPKLQFMLSGKTSKGGQMSEGYCVKCRKKQEMQNAQAITMKNGKPAMTGTCPSCGTKMFKIGAAS